MRMLLVSAARVDKIWVRLRGQRREAQFEACTSPHSEALAHVSQPYASRVIWPRARCHMTGTRSMRAVGVAVTRRRTIVDTAVGVGQPVST